MNSNEITTLSSNNINNKKVKKTKIEKDENKIKQEDAFKLTEYIGKKYGFKIVNNLGKGGYSYMFEIKTNKTSNVYACKIEIVKNKKLTLLDIKKTEEKNLLRDIEKSLSKTLKNMNIIKTLATFKDEYNDGKETYTIHSIFMEKSTIGNLNKFIQYFNKGYICRNTINPYKYNINWIFNLSEFTIKKFVNDIVNGLQYIKLANLVHFDIKPENILLCKEYVLKICDFSLLKIVDKESTKINVNYSTFVYQDPSVYNSENCIDLTDVYKVDLFSLGCIIFFMIFKKFLIDKNLKDYNNLEKNKKSVIECVDKGIKEIKKSEEISKNLKDLMENLLNPNIKDRIGLNELSQNKFLNEGLENIKKCVYSNYNEHYKSFIEFQKLETLKNRKRFLKKKKVLLKFNRIKK